VTRAAIISLITIIAVIAIGATMTVLGRSGVLTGHPMFSMINPILIVISLVILGVAFYYLRRLKE